MSSQIQRTEYFYTTVKDEPGQAFELLSLLAQTGVNLLAFAAVPIGPLHTQLTLFPADPPKLTRSAKDAGIVLDGPHLAFLVTGDDQLGALTDIHSALYKANVNVYSSTGVTDGRGSFGYVIYVKASDYERATTVLGV
jgi:hypothetical protein